MGGAGIRCGFGLRLSPSGPVVPDYVAAAVGRRNETCNSASLTDYFPNPKPFVSIAFGNHYLSSFPCRAAGRSLDRKEIGLLFYGKGREEKGRNGSPYRWGGETCPAGEAQEEALIQEDRPYDRKRRYGSFLCDLCVLLAAALSFASSVEPECGEVGGRSAFNTGWPRGGFMLGLEPGGCSAKIYPFRPQLLEKRRKTTGRI